MCKLGKKSYGSGYLAGMKLGDMPLVEYTRDRLHREVLRRFGPDTLPESYELTTTYTPGGQLEQQHLNHPQLDREYGYDEGGRLVRISGPQQTRAYRYSDSGRLTGVRTTRPGLDITLPYATDPAGNRLPDPEFYPESSSRVWGDNRITEDMQYLYCYDKYGRLTEKTDRIPEGVIRMNDERTHRYEYDSQHRLVHYVRTQHGETQAEGRYVYDPLGRRVGKRVWKRERSLAGYMALAKKAEVTWYGWEGDRLTTIQTAQSRIQTVYGPGSFTPLVRIETDAAEQAKAHHRSLAEKLEQEGSEDGQAVQLPAALRAMLDRLEGELRRNAVSEESRAWLAGCGLTPEQMAGQLEPHDEPERALHLYHCDQRGLPLALITPDNQVAWRAEYDEWGNLSGEENPAHLEQVIRLPGQQYDEESGLYYNRHRYYNPGQGRYITQDPIGLKGGWNLYNYPLNPVSEIDPLGLSMWDDAKSGSCTDGFCNALSFIIGPSKFDSEEDAALDALKNINNQSICSGTEYGGLICKDVKNKYFATTPISGTNDGLTLSALACPQNTTNSADYHTHGMEEAGYENNKFSPLDISDNYKNYRNGYLGTPDGTFGKVDISYKTVTYQKNKLTDHCEIR
ncbi:RHS repeat protein [Salmonella enterica]|nr:RHS repeat protein [Salmonella enterica]